MTSPSLVLRVLFGVCVVALTGCGASSADEVQPTVASSSGDSPGAPPTSSAPAQPETSTAPAEGDDDAVIAWMGGYCSAVTPLSERFDALDQDFTGQSAEQIMQTLIDSFQGMGPAFAEAGAAVSAVGVPPVEGGQDIAELLDTSFASAASAYASLGDDMAAAGTGDVDVLEALLDAAEPEILGATTALAEAFNREDLGRAYLAAAQCEGIDFT